MTVSRKIVFAEKIFLDGHTYSLEVVETSQGRRHFIIGAVAHRHYQEDDSQHVAISEKHLPAFFKALEKAQRFLGSAAPESVHECNASKPDIPEHTSDGRGKRKTCCDRLTGQVRTSKYSPRCFGGILNQFIAGFKSSALRR